MGCRAPAVIRYALPYHPTSSEEWKSSVMRGTALGGRNQFRSYITRGSQDALTVATIVLSSETRKTDRHIPTVRRERARGPGYSWGPSMTSSLWGRCSRSVRVWVRRILLSVGRAESPSRPPLFSVGAGPSIGELCWRISPPPIGQD